MAPGSCEARIRTPGQDAPSITEGFTINSKREEASPLSLYGREKHPVKEILVVSNFMEGKMVKVTSSAVRAAIRIVPALILALILLFAYGCGGDEQGTTAATGTTATTPATVGTTATATPMVPSGSTVEVPPPPPPATVPAPPTAPKIIDYRVDPNTVHAGAALTCTVTVEGEAVSVRMGLTGPSGSVPQTVNLVKGATGGGITTWSAVTTAPATVGGWRFGATATAADGTEVIPEAGGLSASLLPFEVIP